MEALLKPVAVEPAETLAKGAARKRSFAQQLRENAALMPPEVGADYLAWAAQADDEADIIHTCAVASAVAAGAWAVIPVVGSLGIVFGLDTAFLTPMTLGMVIYIGKLHGHSYTFFPGYYRVGLNMVIMHDRGRDVHYWTPPAVGWDQGADRASNDADVSLIPPIIPYGGFSPVRLKGRLSGDAFPIRPSV